jgi:hypothetical protein
MQGGLPRALVPTGCPGCRLCDRGLVNPLTGPCATSSLCELFQSTP